MGGETVVVSDARGATGDLSLDFDAASAGLRCASLRFTGGSMRRIAAALALALPVSPARAKTKSAKEPRAG